MLSCKWDFKCLMSHLTCSSHTNKSCRAASVEENRTLFSVWQDINKVKITGILKQWILLPLLWLGGPPELNAHTAAHSALTAGRGGVGCIGGEEKKIHTDQFGLFLSLLCRFLCFLLLFLQTLLWLGLLLLRRRSEAGRGTKHKHESQLPPSIPPASHEEVVDRLGKFILSHHHLKLLSLRYLLIPLLDPQEKKEKKPSCLNLRYCRVRLSQTQTIV